CTAFTWVPPLCEKAAAPTHGRRGFGRRFAVSSRDWDSSLSCASESRGTDGTWYLNSRIGITLVRLQLPVRSPYPLSVPCTCVVPASSEGSALATPRPLSSWGWELHRH